MKKLTLTLLVTWVLADDAHDALAADDAAGFTKLFDGWTDSHLGDTRKIKRAPNAIGRRGAGSFNTPGWGRNFVFGVFHSAERHPGLAIDTSSQ